MNDYIAAVLIGIVEGLTEFLPVSSTAHIRFTQELLGLPSDSEYWKMFAIVIQLGAILSVVIYFRTRLIGFLNSFLNNDSKNSLTDSSLDPDSNSPPKSNRWHHPFVLILIAFVVTAIPCYIIDKKIGENLESLPVMGWSLLIGGILMWIIDIAFGNRGKTDRIENVTLTQAVFIGAMQIFSAAFPGTSRSMSTIAGGQLVGLSRGTALEFSFFLSIPVMVAATSFKLGKFLLESPIAMTGKDWGVLAIGFLVSFAVALAVIAWFMNWVRQRGFIPFAIYRIVAGIVVLYFVNK